MTCEEWFRLRICEAVRARPRENTLGYTSASKAGSDDLRRSEQSLPGAGPCPQALSSFSETSHENGPEALA
jgi:hypothetical protein